MSKNQAGETTPLLWPQQSAFPGSGAFPAPGQFPGLNQFGGGGRGTGNSQFRGSGNYQFYNRFGGSGGGGFGGGFGGGAGGNGGVGGYGGTRPQTPVQSSKAIVKDGNLGRDPHSQFVALTGCPPTNAPPEFKYTCNERTLYGRAVHQVRQQNFTYQLTAALTNTLLMMQIVLGAALTGLGGTNLPRWVITVFGATNTIIAGLVAWLKSRGQPMRARMFRDDLERVVDEIENSEVMWLGISKGVHGYDDIDTEEEVTVRSEVARLTRLLDKAIKTNCANNPDLYSAGGSDSSGGSSGLRQQGGGGGGGQFMNLASLNMPEGVNAAGNLPQAYGIEDVNDAAPATKLKKKEDDTKKDETKKEEEKKSDAAATTTPAASSTDNKTKDTTTSSTSASTSKQTYATAAASDPDASPATTLTKKKSAPESAPAPAPKKEAGEPEE